MRSAQKWITRCTETGIFYGITTVLSKFTLGQVKDINELAEDMGGKSIIFLPLKPFGDVASNKYYQQYSLSPKEQTKALKDIYTEPSDIGNLLRRTFSLEFIGKIWF